MEELLRYAIEGGSFGVSLFLAYFLFKKFIRKGVIDPIEEIKEEYAELKKSFTAFTERISTFVFNLIKSNQELSDRVTKEVSGMQNLFSEATRHTSEAKIEASEALKKVNVLEKTTDKLLKIASSIHEKNKSLETEVTKLNHDMVFVKTKVRKDES